MGVQFERLTHSPESSLTLVVDDIMRQRTNGLAYSKADVVDLEAWLNALHRQSRPLIHSEKGRAGLIAWLDAVEQQSPAPSL